MTRIFWLFACSALLHGQRFSVGIIGGTNVTDHFPAREERTPADGFGNPAYHFQYLTGPRSFIVGGAIEGHITESVSIEANILHRPMKNIINLTEFHPDGQTVRRSESFTAVRAWQFPVLLKYTFQPLSPGARVRPFIAAGPSFRAQEDATATEPSQFGFTAGAGASIRIGRARLAPTLRYTRWKREDIFPRYPTKQDQLEVLTSFTFDTTARERSIRGHRLGIGAVAGFPFSKGLPQEGTRYLAGLTVETELTSRLSIEANALYRPIRLRNPLETRFSVLTWQIPVLAKYAWPRSGWTPFVEGGPSFRLAGNLNGYNPSRFGGTLGFGLSKHVSAVRLEPALRYTRWRRDNMQFLSTRVSTNVHSIDFVMGISF